MASFAIVVLMGAAAALYLCTPRAEADALAPGEAVAFGFKAAALTFLLMLVVTLGTTLAGMADAADQLRATGKVATPGWMKATVSARLGLVYLLYGWLGFALGGTVAGTVRLLVGGS
jgi:hypothetical protein